MNALFPESPKTRNRRVLTRSQQYDRGPVEQLIERQTPESVSERDEISGQSIRHGARFDAPKQLTEQALRDAIMDRLERRGRVVARQIIEKSGPYLTIDEVAAQFSKNPQEIRDAISRKELIAVDEPGDKEPTLPQWQFDTSGPIPGLADVLKALNSEDSVEALLFMQSPSPQINGKSPLTLLAAKNIEAAVGLAERQGEHGAQ